MNRFGIVSIVIVVATAGTATAGTTTFDNGHEGWGVFFGNDGVLGDFIEPAGGNPGAHLRWTMVDTFGCNFHNDSNPEYIGDYSRFSQGVRLSVDVKVDEISFFGTPVERNLIVELVDFNPPSDPYPWTSVWYNLGPISQAQTSNWTTFEVLISDPTATALPPGWGGTGAEDPNTFEPILPPNRTFASVLANVEEIRFTTFEPGFFYGFTNFQLRFDNPTVAAIPEPGTLALLAIGALALKRRR
ncbi:MAG: PEP-CTERM sorting domain-containing protein [Phycisphaerae bacterium]|nr:PEP-CTERM sorting domain-containing protein [Phycisphaerae bacterium]NUQ45348.1 PEP-CTERM sorting domain-containing protein [Phycisphaerae bacterium]